MLIRAASWYMSGRNFLLWSWDAPSCTSGKICHSNDKSGSHVPNMGMGVRYPDLDDRVDVGVGAVCKPEGTQPEHTEIMLILTEKEARFINTANWT